MAIDEREEWPNEHTIYLATPGGGKGSMLRGNPSIPKPSQGVRIIVWDRAKAYPANYYRNRPQFAKRLEQAVNSGKGFAIGYTGGDASNIVAEHEWCTSLVWHKCSTVITARTSLTKRCQKPVKQLAKPNITGR